MKTCVEKTFVRAVRNMKKHGLVYPKIHSININVLKIWSLTMTEIYHFTSVKDAKNRLYSKHLMIAIKIGRRMVMQIRK